MYQVYISIDCEIFTQQVPGLLCYEKKSHETSFRMAANMSDICLSTQSPVEANCLRFLLTTTLPVYICPLSESSRMF